jgi:hypothetical protein
MKRSNLNDGKKDPRLKSGRHMTYRPSQFLDILLKNYSKNDDLCGKHGQLLLQLRRRVSWARFNGELLNNQIPNYE